MSKGTIIVHFTFTRAKYLKSNGCLTDGSVRDVKMIREMSYPVFAGNISPLDSKYRGKLTWYDVPGKINGVSIESGDFVFGDVDGVVIIPKGKVEVIITESLKKVSDENNVRSELINGKSLKYIFDKYKIL